MNIHVGDNLETLAALVKQGRKYDLIEIDGPYGFTNLEAGWDDLTEAEYIQHYAQRLELVKQLLQPWGAVYLFGYPEGCAEIKAWAGKTGTLYLRRWLSWHKQLTAHKGRKIETILFFLRGSPNQEAAQAFGQMLKAEREARGWTLAQVQAQAEALGAERPWWKRGGNLYFETGSGGQPSADDLALLARIFNFDPEPWAHVVVGSYEGITNIDYISRTWPEDTEALNDSGLRSKPIGLYMELFAPVKPTHPNPQALILYGGSGNAAIAAEALGYQATVCELSPIRAEKIQKRAGKLLPKWQSKARARQAALPMVEVQQPALFL